MYIVKRKQSSACDGENLCGICINSRFVFVTLRTKLVMPMFSVEDISEYIVALIASFASRYNMTDVEAYKYLNRYGAIKVAHDFYDVMHTQPMDDMVQSMWRYCNRKGGSL